MSRGRRDRRDEPDGTGYDSRESQRSRRSGGRDEERPPSSRARHGGDSGYSSDGGYGRDGGYEGDGGYATGGGYSGSGGYDSYQNGAYTGSGYPENGYSNGAYGGDSRRDDGYGGGGYDSYSRNDYGDSGYERGQHSGGGYPGGQSGGFGQPDPYASPDPYTGPDSRSSGPYGRPDPRGATDPRGTGSPYSGALEPYSGGSGSGYGALEPYRGGAGYDGAGYNSAGYNSGGYDRPGYDSGGYNGAGYDSAGYDSAGYDRSGYEGDSRGWAGAGERGYGGADAYDDPGGYGNRGDYSGQSQYGGSSAYGSGDPYDERDATGPGGGQAAAYGGGYDDRDYEPSWASSQDDDHYSPSLDDTGMTRRRSRGEDEIDADDARHNNFFRGFGRGDDDYTHRPPKKRRSRAGMVALTVLVLFLAGIVGGGVYGYKWYAKRHANWSGSGYGSVLVQVPSGAIACGPSLENTLVNKGIVASATAFCDAAKAAGNSSLLQPGYFRLHKHMNAALAWALIISPKARVQTNVAIPDGIRASKIIALLAAKTGIPLSHFQSALKNDVSQLGLPSWAKGNPEGFLYPATYPIQPGTSALAILKTMVAKFNNVVGPMNLAAKAKTAQIPEYHVIIEASLLEGEVGPQYFSAVAQVIDNRLNQHWYLGLDSTVAYAVNKYIYNLTQTELHSKSVYNTTNHYGLPPGPIDSPDVEAIDAVLHPNKAYVNDMYFVTINKKGTTLFTSSQTQFIQWGKEAVRNGV